MLRLPLSTVWADRRAGCTSSRLLPSFSLRKPSRLIVCRRMSGPTFPAEDRAEQLTTTIVTEMVAHTSWPLMQPCADGASIPRLGHVATPTPCILVAILLGLDLRIMGSAFGLWEP